MAVDAQLAAPQPRPSGLVRQVRRLAEAAGLLCFLGLCRVLPVDWASAMGGALGRAIGSRLGISRRARRNLAGALPELSAEAREAILRGMWDNLGRTAAEYAHLPRICDLGSGRIEVRDGQVVTALGSDGKAGIIFGGHFANWEVGPYVLRALLGQPLASVEREPNNPWVARLLNRLRRAPATINKGGEGGRTLVRLIRNGGHAGILLDQKMNDGLAVPFFGRDAMTSSAAARLALRYRCPLVPAYAERLQGARFRVTIFPPLALEPTGDSERDVLALMTRINAMLEDWVRHRPEQWLWVHSRWPD